MASKLKWKQVLFNLNAEEKTFVSETEKAVLFKIPKTDYYFYYPKSLVKFENSAILIEGTNRVAVLLYKDNTKVQLLKKESKQYGPRTYDKYVRIEQKKGQDNNIQEEEISEISFDEIKEKYLTHQKYYVVKNYIPKVRIIYKDDLKDILENYNIAFDRSSYTMEDLEEKGIIERDEDRDAFLITPKNQKYLGKSKEYLFVDFDSEDNIISIYNNYKDLINKANSLVKIDTIEKDKELKNKKDEFLEEENNNNISNKETEYECEFDIGR